MWTLEGLAGRLEDRTSRWTQAAGELRGEAVSPDTAAKSVAVPALEVGEKLIAAFLVPRLNSGGGGH